MARKQAGSSGGGMVVVIIILTLLVVAAYFYWSAQWKQSAAPANPASLTVGIIEDDGIVYGGEPRPRAGAGEEMGFTVLKNQAYVSGYSESRRDPLWVAYHVIHVATPFNLPRPGGFSTDKRTAALVKDSDYRGSGYDRGHMAPNSAITRDFGEVAQQETFLLSNVCPQSKKLNEEVWEKLEVAEKNYSDEFEEVWVIDGPVFGDLNGGRTDRLASGIAVPTAFFKILIDEQDQPGGSPRVFSVIMPQDVKGTELPQQYLTNVAEIEKETHLEFLWKLDAATRAELESKVFKMW